MWETVVKGGRGAAWHPQTKTGDRDQYGRAPLVLLKQICVLLNLRQSDRALLILILLSDFLQIHTNTRRDIYILFAGFPFPIERKNIRGLLWRGAATRLSGSLRDTENRINVAAVCSTPQYTGLSARLELEYGEKEEKMEIKFVRLKPRRFYNYWVEGRTSGWRNVANYLKMDVSLRHGISGCPSTAFRQVFMRPGITRARG